MASQAVDLYVLYRIIKDIGTPFKDTDAYKLGLIDDKGKRLKKASSSEEKKAIGFYTRFVFNIKRALSKVGLDSKIGTAAGALFLLRESQSGKEFTEEDIIKGINEEMQYLDEATMKTYSEFFREDAPTMSTGPAVAGTGDDPVHWKKMGRPRVRGKAIDGVAYLKRMNRMRTANTVVKNG
jgi:hypothetical protein